MGWAPPELPPEEFFERMTPEERKRWHERERELLLKVRAYNSSMSFGAMPWAMLAILAFVIGMIWIVR